LRSRLTSGQESVLDVLLGDGGAALDHFAGFQVGLHRPYEGTHIHTRVHPEALVLDGYDRVHQMAGELVVADQHPVFARVPLGERRPVDGVHHAREAARSYARILDGLYCAGGGHQRYNQHARRAARHFRFSWWLATAREG